MKSFQRIVSLLLPLAVSCHSQSSKSRYGHEVDEVLEAKRSEVAACYESGVSSQFGMVGGKVTVRFVIGLDGKVESAQLVEAETTLEHGPTLECVVGVVRATEFPPPAKRTPVRYPMDFGL